MQTSKLPKAKPTFIGRSPIFYIMNEETVVRSIREKRNKLHMLALQIANKKIQTRILERKRDELRDQLLILSEVLPKIDKQERRMKIVSERLQHS